MKRHYKNYRIGGATKRVFICYLVGSPDNLDKNFIKLVEKYTYSFEEIVDIFLLKSNINYFAKIHDIIDIYKEKGEKLWRQ